MYGRVIILLRQCRKPQVLSWKMEFYTLVEGTFHVSFFIDFEMMLFYD